MHQHSYHDTTFSCQFSFLSYGTSFCRLSSSVAFITCMRKCDIMHCLQNHWHIYHPQVAVLRQSGGLRYVSTISPPILFAGCPLLSIITGCFNMIANTVSACRLPRTPRSFCYILQAATLIHGTHTGWHSLQDFSSCFSFSLHLLCQACR